MEPPPSPKISYIHWCDDRVFSISSTIYRVDYDKALRENNLEVLEQLGNMVSMVLRTPIVGIFRFDNGTEIPQTFRPDEYTGDIKVTITAYLHDYPNTRPKVTQLMVDDLSRVEVMILDRLLTCERMEVTYTLPDFDVGYTQEYTNREVAGLGGPANARHRVVENITENYHKCRIAVSDALARSSLTNYSTETGMYTYLLFDFHALGGNLERLEAALKLSGWRHVKFTEQPHSTLLELK